MLHHKLQLSLFIIEGHENSVLADDRNQFPTFYSRDFGMVQTNLNLVHTYN